MDFLLQTRVWVAVNITTRNRQHQQLRVLAGDSCYPGAVAIARTLLHPAVTGAIAGIRQLEHVDEWVPVTEIHLAQEELWEIEIVAEAIA